MPGAELVVNEQEAALVRLVFEKFPTMTTRQLVLFGLRVFWPKAKLLRRRDIFSSRGPR